MNKVALITGASSGLGLALSQRLAALDYDLILVARSIDKLNQLKQALEIKHKITVNIIQQDLSAVDAAAKVFNFVKTQGLSVGLLVNNAGFGLHGLFQDLSLSEQLEMIQVNISTLTALSYLYLNHCQRKNGHVVNIASTAAFQPGPKMAVYYASKAYVLSFSEALAQELKTSKVFVTTICPGPTKTGFQTRAALADVKWLTSDRLPSADDVARYIIKAIKKKKRLGIPGFSNKLLALFSKFLPRKVITQFVSKIQSNK